MACKRKRAGDSKLESQLGTGLPDFLWHNLPKRTKIYQIATKLPNVHKIYHSAVIYYNCPHKITTFSFFRLSKIYPNWNFGLKIHHLAILVVKERKNYCQWMDGCGSEDRGRNFIICQSLRSSQLCRWFSLSRNTGATTRLELLCLLGQ
jgi:hypothetical protein